MLDELALATAMVLLTVVIHAVGLYGVGRLLRLEEREEAAEHIHPLSARGFAVTLFAIVSLDRAAWRRDLALRLPLCRDRRGRGAARRSLFLDRHLWRDRL